VYVRAAAVDLMLEQLQRDRHLAEVRLRLEQEKKAAEESRLQQQQQQADKHGREDETVDGRASFVMKPVTDKLGRTIARPPRPL